MRIPIQALSFYLSESDGKPFLEERQATPVNSSAKLRATLSDYLSKQRESRHQSHGKRDGQNSKLHGVDDRRQGERRKQKQPILLDTRLTQRRCESNGNSAISFEI